MIVFCHGMVKSGSSFATQITLGLIRQHCVISGGNVLDLREFVPNSNGIYINTEEDIDHYLTSILQSEILEKDFLIIKWHGICTPLISRLISDSRIRAISTYRNPIEIALSLLDVAKKEADADKMRFPRYKTIDDTLIDIDYQIECFRTWAAVDGVEKIFFDDIASSSYDLGERLSKRLGIEYDASVIDSLLADKKNIWEFNKGVLNRAQSELDEVEFNKYGQYWNEFIRFINSSL